jgi:predicted alpha/beta-fold hydrolase
MIYTRNFLATMKRKSMQKLRQHPGLFDGDRVRSARTLREFDDLVTAPLHGFRDVDDYWTRASSKPHLSRIAVPTLLMNARNDPFLPASALPQERELSAAVTACFPDEGGHAGFMTGFFPGTLAGLSDIALGFLSAP